MPAEPQEPQRKGLKGALTRKIGPLPTWGWVVLVAALIFAWAWWKNRQAGTAAQTATAGAGQVPQFVNQTFTQVQPPAAADQDQDEDKEPKPQSFPVGMVPQPGPRRDRDRPPFGQGSPPGPPAGAGGVPREHRKRRRHKVAA